MGPREPVLGKSPLTPREMSWTAPQQINSFDQSARGSRPSIDGLTGAQMRWAFRVNSLRKELKSSSQVEC